MRCIRVLSRLGQQFDGQVLRLRSGDGRHRAQLQILEMNRSFIIILVTLLGMFMPVKAQGERSSGIIGRMDNVEIRVFREDELTTSGQLSEDGTITMPLIGSVRIQGLTTDQAAAAITRKLKDGYLVKPEVSVSIEARIRRTITVLGQAQRPGVFELPAHR
ncbi:MAG: hypothetical protein EOP85_12120, partial [Verrucomicrobiaceae bacterium]